MQTFQRAAAVFCVACISAELVTFLVGSVRAGRCIKAAAGLYILAVLFSILPGLPAKLAAAVPQTASVQADSLWEQTQAQLLARAAAQLEESCTAQCRQQFGVEIQLSITLRSTEQGTEAAQAAVCFPASCTSGTKQAVLQLLQQELGVAPTVMEGAVQP